MNLDVRDLVCPLITPFSNSDLPKMIRRVHAGGKGANIVFVLGTTGEAFSLEESKRRDVVEIAAATVRKINEEYGARSLELAVGVTGWNLKRSIDFANHAAEQKADYAVILPVYITRKPSGELTRRGTRGSMEQFLDETSPDIGCMIYNHPGLTAGKNLRTDVWKTLAKHPRVVAIKDSSGDPARLRHYRQAAGGNAKVYAGDEVLGLKVYSDGIVAGGANLFPAPWGVATRSYSSEFGAATAKVLVNFAEIYRRNPVGIIKDVLGMSKVIEDSRVFDSRFGSNSGELEAAEDLMGHKDFKAFFGVK